MVALGIEFADELADGAKGAALPQIGSDLRLSYAELGLLVAVPLLAGGLIELPLGLIAGTGRRRHRLVLAGGLVVTASLALAAAAGSLAMLMVAFVACFPASGAFVSLTQSALMDADPARRQQRMAAWNLTGSAGAVGGPLLVAAVLAAGGAWRSGYLLLAAVAGIALAGAAVAGPARPARPARPASVPAGQSAATGTTEEPDPPATSALDGGGARRPTAREALAALRAGETARWLVLLQIGDLLLDVLTGFVGVYLVAIAHASAAQAALGVAIRLAAGLTGDAAFTAISGRVSGPAVVRAGAMAAAIGYPAFLLVPSLPGKLVLLALVSLATAPWYPVMQAGLYDSLPGRSGIAVSLSTAAGLAGAAGPLAIGFLAQRSGLAWALAALTAAPAGVLALLPRRPRPRARRMSR